MSVTLEQLKQLLASCGYEANIEIVGDKEHEDEANIWQTSNENYSTSNFLDGTVELSEFDKYLYDSHSGNCHQDYGSELGVFLLGFHSQAETQESSLEDILNYIQEESPYRSEKNSFQFGREEEGASVASNRREALLGEVENNKKVWNGMDMTRNEFENFLTLPNNFQSQAFNNEESEPFYSIQEESDNKMEKKSLQFRFEEVNSNTSTITPTSKQKVRKSKTKKRTGVESKVMMRPKGRPSKAKKALEEYQCKVNQCRLEFAEMIEEQVKSFLNNEDYTEQDLLNTIVSETLSLPHFVA